MGFQTRERIINHDYDDTYPVIILGKIKMLELDVLKPHEPILPYFAEELAKIPHVIDVNVSVIEMDVETQTIKLTILGNDIDYEDVCNTIEKNGGSIHSVDKVSAGT